MIHFRIGNIKIRDLRAFLQRVWPDISAFGATHKLVNAAAPQIGARFAFFAGAKNRCFLPEKGGAGLDNRARQEVN